MSQPKRGKVMAGRIRDDALIIANAETGYIPTLVHDPAQHETPFGVYRISVVIEHENGKLIRAWSGNRSDGMHKEDSDNPSSFVQSVAIRHGVAFNEKLL
jgi:hypothetical protein